MTAVETRLYLKSLESNEHFGHVQASIAVWWDLKHGSSVNDIVDQFDGLGYLYHENIKWMSVYSKYLEREFEARKLDHEIDGPTENEHINTYFMTLTSGLTFGEHQLKHVNMLCEFGCRNINLFDRMSIHNIDELTNMLYLARKLTHKPTKNNTLISERVMRECWKSIIRTESTSYEVHLVGLKLKAGFSPFKLTNIQKYQDVNLFCHQ